MWVTSGRASGRKKTLLQYSLERECYEEEVQPYRKMNYKPMMMSVYVGGYWGLCVFGKLCPVGFIVVCKCSSGLLQSIVIFNYFFVILW